ncbi:MAG: hypothetical protein JWM59_2261 [Verrucomicrobiales bacterium]|nr:hypothetical protein [Verrucomicrobiales bacterium]
MPRVPRLPPASDLMKEGPASRTRKPGQAPSAVAARHPRQRPKVLASQAASRDFQDGGSHSPLMTVKTLYAALAWIILLPACLITTHALTVGFGDSLGHSFWRTPAFWFFGMGMVLWLITFTTLPRPVVVYVWAHEMTHALFVILCGGSVREFHYTSKGGYVLTDKNNILIALSPYFFPLYTVLVVPLCLLAGAVVDLTLMLKLPGGFGVRPLWGVFLLIGLTWGFHLTFTLWMIARDQPDLRINGVFFSSTLIYLVNILLLAGLLILAAPELSLPGFVSTWKADAQGMAHAVGGVWSSIWRMAGG